MPADFWTDRKGQAIVALVVHGTGGTDSRATLQHGDGRGVSIHRLITKAGLIYAMVSDDHGANHAGAPTSLFTLNGKTYTGGLVNRATLGVELESLQRGRPDDYTEPQLAALGWQVADWRRQYGPLPILRHADLDPTRRRDPYQLSTQEIERWAALAVAQPLSAKRYRVRGTPVYQDQACKGIVALYLNPGAIVEVDKTYPESTAHLKTGAGFIKLDASVEAL